MKKKLVTALGVFGLGIVLLSVAKSEEPKMKRYEVIRSVNGEVTIYDTLVAENSTFTPEDYLTQLGFSNDEHVEILDISAMRPEHLDGPYPPGIFPGVDSLIVMEIQGDPAQMDSMYQIQIQGDPSLMDSLGIVEIQMIHGAVNLEGDSGQWMIERNMIKQVDSLNQELVKLQQTIELTLLDNLTEPLMIPNGDSGIAIMYTVIVDEGGSHDQVTWTPTNGSPDFERHTENGNKQSDLIVYSEGQDFTLLIVSDASDLSPTKSPVQLESVKTSEKAFQIYPNPANKEVSVQLNFEEKALTTITVSDASGKVVMQVELGDFVGYYNQMIDVSRWKKGIYFVNVDRPGMKLVEKLVVE